MNKYNDEATIKCFHNIMESIKTDINLPEYVFSDGWSYFYFFESDRIFSSSFVGIIQNILRIEKSTVSCLLNVDKTEFFEADSIAAIFIDENTTSSYFDGQLRGNGPVDGWIYRVDKYICCSDVGIWCVYCEKDNDIALIGFKEGVSADQFRIPLSELHAQSILRLFGTASGERFPFNRLTPTWRASLLKNYS